MPALQRRVLPVVRWLQVGGAAVGVGMAVAVAPAVAWADDAGSSSSADSPRHSTARHGGSDGGQRPGLRHETSAASERSTYGDDSEVPDTPRSPRATAAAVRQRISDDLPESAAAAPAPSSAPDQASEVVIVPQRAEPVAEATSGGTAAPAPDPLGQAQAFLGLPGAPATAAPSLGALPILLRLNVEDVFTGTGPPVVSNPTAVVTGLFNQVLRKDPTGTELQTYLNVFSLAGINGVVAGLYSSSAFRAAEVGNYYLELLGRTPTQQELAWGTTRLMWGTPEPLFAASLAGTDEFYAGSAAGGGPYGTQPSATTYVNLLYRTLLGQAADPTQTAIYVQKLQAGQPLGLAALNFVTADPYRGVKVGEIFGVLGQTATPAEISGYVRNWFFDGGLAGITTSLLATSANVARIEAGQVSLPDMAAVADLQKLLLAAYTDSPEGFTKLFNELLTLDPANPIGAQNPCTPSNTSCNQGLYRLVTTGGSSRGIPNSSLTLTSITADVATLVPTQNQIDLTASLKFPLQNPAQLEDYFNGGTNEPYANPVVTANNGTYIVDGHHRWSAIVLINPYTRVTALDLGYVPTPQTALKEAQVGVMADKGFLKSATVEGENLYTIGETTFKDRVREFIATGTDPKKEMAIFGKYLGFDPGVTPLERQYAIVEDYLWGNVVRMRERNPYIPGAPSRSVMPQTDPLPVVAGYLAGGALSYSFPTISHLG
jgi:hypothetical protein